MSAALTDAERLEVAQRISTDLAFYCENFIKIRDKEGRLVPFIPNRCQRHVIEVLERQRREGRPRRIISVKSRQLGFSTIIHAEQLRDATWHDSNCLLLVHKENAGKKMFRKIELMHENLPDEWKPPVGGREKGTLLEFTSPMDSAIQRESAENRDAGRSGTYQHLHLTELPYWADADETMGGLLPTVKKSPATTIVIESTAKGVGDYFHTQWLAAVEGTSEFEPIFLPWYWMEEYERPRRDSDNPLSADEREYAKRYELTFEQMMWRREMIAELPRGLEQFQQEYPGCWQEAFATAGRKVLSGQTLDDMQLKVRPPIVKGEFEVSGGRARLSERGDGELWVWEKPQAGHAYVVCGDPASGSSTSRDNSAAHVLDVRTQGLVQVASFRGKRTPEEFAVLLRRLGLAYGTALIAHERNTFGMHVTDVLRKKGYGRIYRFRPKDRDGYFESTNYGFPTNRATKMPLVHKLAQYCREGMLIVQCERTMSELRSFIYLDDLDGTAGAMSGAKDDCVMSIGVGVWASEQVFVAEPEDEYDPGDYAPLISDKTGY